ncbi:Heme exporter protein C [Escherichia coli]|uniref:Heme exporter protein C n=1 Tax=Escherichia coli TaxID=562 RepID=A0A376WAH6_ECOLX|nr:Heme exporter protein C [Escherichia coli]
MWKTLHQLAIPPRLYQICGWFIPWLAIASVVVLTVGWIWGFGFAPADYQQGNSYRIIYLHVPAANLVDGHLCINGGGSVYWPGLADENGQPGGGGDGPHWCRVLPLLPWLPALHGENRCGAPGGYGMHV